jgi:acyl-CoA dehydrogenase
MTIDFELPDNLSNVRDMARWFAQTAVRPVAIEADRTGEVPESLLRQMKELGISGGAVFRGEGAAGVSGNGDRKEKFVNRLAIVGVEELAWGDPAVMLSASGPGLGGPPVRFMGTEEQRRRFFGIFDGDELRWGAYALTEPAAGSDVAGIRASCRKDGDEWVLNGVKCYITNGARASWVVCFATIDPKLGRGGHRAFVVEKGTPGFRVGRIEKKMGLRASETAELVFENCRVPSENLLGGEAHYERKEGFMAAMKTFDTTRPMVASMAVGIGRAAWEETQSFYKENYMVGRPIARYRRLAERLGSMKRRLDTARLMCWHAAWMADRGVANAKEAAMCKAYAPRVAQDIATGCLQILGAHGVADGSIVEKCFRDLKVYDIFEGTGQVQRIVISKRIIEGLKRF